MADTYVLLATKLRLRSDGSRTVFCRGDTVTGLSGEQVSRLTKAGVIAPVSGVATPASSAESPAAAPAGPAGKPPRVATKPVLVDWLAEHAGLDRAELQTQSKDDLWSLIDATD